MLEFQLPTPSLIIVERKVLSGNISSIQKTMSYVRERKMLVSWATTSLIDSAPKGKPRKREMKELNSACILIDLKCQKGR